MRYNSCDQRCRLRKLLARSSLPFSGPSVAEQMGREGSGENHDICGNNFYLYSFAGCFFLMKLQARLSPSPRATWQARQAKPSRGGKAIRQLFVSQLADDRSSTILCFLPVEMASITASPAPFHPILCRFAVPHHNQRERGDPLCPPATDPEKNRHITTPDFTSYPTPLLSAFLPRDRSGYAMLCDATRCE